MFDNCFSDSGENMPKNEESFNPELSDAPSLLNELNPQKFPSYLAAIMGTANLPFPMKPLSSEVLREDEKNSPGDEFLKMSDNIHSENNAEQNLSENLQNETSEQKDIPKKSNRGRKKKKVTPEILKADAMKRMEKNRIYAQENRNRKKEYVNKLESEVFF